MRTALLFSSILGAAWAAGPNAPASAPRLDSWKVIGPGGGGAQFLPAISPHDPKLVVVRCDMSGAYITLNGGESWRMFNLRGTVRFFAFDPKEPKTIYAATFGLFRSTDTGRTWRLIYPAPSSVTGTGMPDDHAGVRVTVADGRSRRPAALAVDPADSKTLYLAVSEGRGAATELLVSRDHGTTWTSDTNLEGGARAIYVDARSPVRDRTLYVIGANSVTVREAGRWTRQPAPQGVSDFIDASAGFPEKGKPVVYAIAREGLFVSADGGASWRASKESAAAAARLTAIATSLYHPEVAYVSYGRLRQNDAVWFGVARTSDSGETWNLAWKESADSAPNIKDVWISERFGPGWGSNPINLGVSPVNPDLCYGTDYGRTMRTTDGGKTWEGVYSRKVEGGYTTTGLDVTTNYGVHWDPFDRKRVFISYTDIGLFRSEDGGTTWLSSSQGVPRQWVNTTYWMEFDPQVKGRVWAVMSGIHDLPRPKMWRSQAVSRYNGGVAVSDDGGNTWRPASDSLPPTAATHILLDPKSPVEARTLYVAGFGRGVFKSADGGKTWALKNKGIAGAEPFAWRLTRDPAGVLYLVVARRTEDGSHGNEGDGALYRSRDGAESWERIPLPEGLNGPNGLAADPKRHSRLYLAAWARNSGPRGQDGGIFLSDDAGKTWRNVLSADQHVYDVTIDPRNPAILYACGFESSAWRSADRGETWKRIPGYNFKWGHRVVPDPFDASRIFVTTYGGSVWYGPAAGDPKAAEDIVTPEAKPAQR